MIFKGLRFSFTAKFITKEGQEDSSESLAEFLDLISMPEERPYVKYVGVITDIR